MRRKRPRNQYVVKRRRVGLDPYPSEPDGSVWQLHLLQEEAAREETDAFAVLSIGGNDARAAFASSLDLDTIVETMTRRGIVEAYTQLASDVAKLSAGLILVLVYHPRVTPVPLLWLLPPQPVITRLIAKFSFMYFETAIARGLPVIDLARTFNPYLGKVSRTASRARAVPVTRPLTTRRITRRRRHRRTMGRRRSSPRIAPECSSPSS